MKLEAIIKISFVNHVPSRVVNLFAFDHHIVDSIKPLDKDARCTIHSFDALFILKFS